MSTATELMAGGVPGQAAKQIGSGPLTTITPAGTTQGTATSITSSQTILGTAAAAGAILPTATGAPVHAVYNNSGNAQNVYPASGETINSSAANVAFSVANGKSAIFIPSGMSWIANLSA